MGDISAEPSMEEILSSIKRIIAEEGEGTPARARRPQRAPVQIAPVERSADIDEVLELSEPMPVAQRAPERPAQAAPPPTPVQAAPVQPASPPEPAEPIVSQHAAAASRGSLDQLTRMVVRPEAAQASAQPDNTLEALVRELLRPMLREWLDARLPDMVEAMVAREIERITGSR